MSHPSSPFVYPRPGIPQHQDPVPSWLCKRLHDLNRLDPDKVPYEASLGGLHHTLLNCYFPATSNFIVQPIPSRRRDGLAPDEDPFPIESYNQEVGRNHADDISHFVVSKSGADLRCDIPLLIWELKRDDAGVDRSAGQLERYVRCCITYAKHRAAMGEQHAVYFALIEQSLVTLMVPSENGLMMMDFFDVLDSRLHQILVDLRSAYP